MKKLFTAAVAALVLAGCSTTQTQPAAPALPALTPQQVATQICPALKVTIPAMQAIIGLPQGAYDDLASANKVINGTPASAMQPATLGLCDVAKVLTGADAASLEQLAFQTVLPLVEASNPKLAAELEIAQIAVGFVNAIQAGAQAGASPAANPAPATTAPLLPVK